MKTMSRSQEDVVDNCLEISYRKKLGWKKKNKTRRWHRDPSIIRRRAKRQQNYSHPTRADSNQTDEEEAAHISNTRSKEKSNKHGFGVPTHASMDFFRERRSGQASKFSQKTIHIPVWSEAFWTRAFPTAHPTTVARRLTNPIVYPSNEPNNL